MNQPEFNHQPVSDIDKIIELYSGDSTLNYVCTTDFGNNHPTDVFYRPTPHPEFGNQYMGVYFTPNDHEHVYIINADSVVNQTIDCIKFNDEYYYSRYRHDFVDTPSGFIDGGRDYTRSTAEVLPAQVINGQLKPINS